MPSLPPLNALRAFEVAARLGSFTRAAEELCVTPGAVSRQIRTLEQHLGMALFTRRHRLVTLTQAGALYAALIAGPFAELARAGEVLRRETQHAEIRLDCIPTLAMHWLLPRLERFRRQFPGLEVDLQTSLGPVNLAADFHLAIRRDPAHFSGLRGTPLMTERCLPVCSPRYAQDHHLDNPGALSGATILQIRAREDLWPSWCGAHGVAAASLGPRLTVDHTFVAMQAAEDGLGVAVLPLLFVTRQLDAGRLVAPFPASQAVSGTYFLLQRQGRASREVETFRQWLVEECHRVNN